MTDRELLQDGVVRLERTGHILLITLNRPEARNAVDQEVAAALGAAVERLADDEGLRVGILTGTGAAFSAGFDLKAFAAGEPAFLDGHRDWGFAGFANHWCPKPIIGAVNGFAFGGGMELALACDLLVAAESARFGLPEVTRGLIAGGGGLPRIVQQLPEKIGAQLVLTGRPIDAAEAGRWGLVNQVVADDALLDTALELAEAIAANAPLAVRVTKQLLADLAHESMWESSTFEHASEAFLGIMASADAAEGARAFAEKRPPAWTGR
jgi:crotonobetainyl-CoA hydratase